MDIGRAFGVPFKDESWLAKTALGALWGLLGVTQPALTGYQLDYTKAVAKEHELPLPDWSERLRSALGPRLPGQRRHVRVLPSRSHSGGNRNPSTHRLEHEWPRGESRRGNDVLHELHDGRVHPRCNGIHPGRTDQLCHA